MGGTRYGTGYLVASRAARLTHELRPSPEARRPVSLGTYVPLQLPRHRRADRRDGPDRQSPVTIVSNRLRAAILPRRCLSNLYAVSSQ